MGGDELSYVHPQEAGANSEQDPVLVSQTFKLYDVTKLQNAAKQQDQMHYSEIVPDSNQAYVHTSFMDYEDDAASFDDLRILEDPFLDI